MRWHRTENSSRSASERRSVRELCHAQPSQACPLPQRTTNAFCVLPRRYPHRGSAHNIFLVIWFIRHLVLQPLLIIFSRRLPGRSANLAGSRCPPSIPARHVQLPTFGLRPSICFRSGAASCWRRDCRHRGPVAVGLTP